MCSNDLRLMFASRVFTDFTPENLLTVSVTKQSENRFAFAYYPKEFQNRKTLL